MKLNQLNQFIIFLLIVIAVAFHSCRKQNDTEDLILKNTGLINSVQVLSGKGRVKFIGSVNQDSPVDKIVIQWDEGNQIILPSGSAVIDTVVQVKEGIVLFNILCYDTEGILLSRSTIAGTSYGNKYRSKLHNRPALLADYSPVSHATTITWEKNRLFFNPVAMEVIYGDTAVVSDHVSDAKMVLPDFDIVNPVFKYRTIFRPDSTCIDTFSTSYTSLEVIDWDKVADSAQQSLENFYIPSGKFYTKNYQSSDWGGYWPTAHVLDVLVDGYLRTGSAAYKMLMDDLIAGMKRKNGNTWDNNYYDDMEWMALACLRAYKATDDDRFKSIADELWQYIKGGISSDIGGGIWENKSKKTKNAPSNGPASIFASRRYAVFHNTEDLNIAKDIYNWERTTLFDPESGLVNDHVDKHNKVTAWKFTYNQGTFLGAGLELYKLTGQSQYLNDAIKAADYAINSLTNNGVLKAEGSGGSDAGLFKGIFIRYLTRLIINDNLTPDKKNTYLNFIKNNAEILWIKGRNKEFGTFENDWTLNTETKTYLTCQLSGIMLIEAMAELRNKGLI